MRKFGPGYSSDNAGDGPPNKKPRIDGISTSRGNTSLPEVAKSKKRSFDLHNNPKHRFQSDDDKRILRILTNQKNCCSQGEIAGCFCSIFTVDGSVNYGKALEEFKNRRREANTYSSEVRTIKLRELFLSVSIFDEKSKSWSRNDVNYNIIHFIIIHN